MNADMTASPTEEQIAEAVKDVECSCLSNASWGSEGYRATAEFAAVDWLNERGLDNSYASAIVALVLVGHP